MNHYSKLCRSRQVHHLQEEDDSQNSSDDSGDCGDESSLFVYAVESNSLAEDEQFHETVELEEKDQNSNGFVSKAQAET